MSDSAIVEQSRRRRWAASGGQHDRAMRLLGVLLPIAVGALAAVMLFAPFAQRSEISFLLSKDEVDVAKERMRVTRAIYRGEDARGRPFALAADSAVQASSRVPVVEMRGMSAALQLDDGLAQIAAPTSRYAMDRETIHIDGPVTMAAASGYRIATRDVSIDLNARRMQSRGRIDGAVPIGRFSADRVAADLDQRVVRLDGNARLVIYQGVL